MVKVVIDTNKVIAGMLSNGKVRKIILFYNLDLLAPEYLINGESLNNIIEELRKKHLKDENKNN